MFRALFIALGSVLMRIHWVVLLFGAVLILAGIKMMLTPENALEPERNPVIRLFRRFVPATPEFHGDRFFIRLDGVLHATPLFIALLLVEVTDVIFAVDSVPAIYGLTDEPLIIFTSNVFAILGLRAMYFMLAGAVDQFHMLRYGLAVILIFVGLKMVWLNAWYGGKFAITLSLGIIASVILASIALSLLFSKAARPRASREGTGGVSPPPGMAPNRGDRDGVNDPVCDRERDAKRPMGEPRQDGRRS